MIASNDDVPDIALQISSQTVRIMCDVLRQLAPSMDDHPYLTPKLALLYTADALETGSAEMQGFLASRRR